MGAGGAAVADPPVSTRTGDSRAVTDRGTHRDHRITEAGDRRTNVRFILPGPDGLTSPVRQEVLFVDADGLHPEGHGGQDRLKGRAGVGCGRATGCTVR